MNATLVPTAQATDVCPCPSRSTFCNVAIVHHPARAARYAFLVNASAIWLNKRTLKESLVVLGQEVLERALLEEPRMETTALQEEMVTARVMKMVDRPKPQMTKEPLQMEVTTRETHQPAMARLQAEPREARGEALTARQVQTLQILALALVAMERMVQTMAWLPLYLPALQHALEILYASTASALRFRAQVLAVLQPVVFFAC